MFESLSDRLSGVFSKFRGQTTLTEENVAEGLREVRLALLEADVNFKVVKDFVGRVRERALGQEVLKGLNPAQQVVKIVHDELVELLGGEQKELELRGKPAVIMLVGLQGSGKTTSSGKLALYLRKKKLSPYLVPADVYRPAAIDQLHTLARELDIPAHPSTTAMNPVEIAREAVAKAKADGHDVVLLDTAGRLAIDEPLMKELAAIKEAVSPTEILFVADAMTGQDAVNTAEKFNELLALSGIVLTKMDGDARGGAALSIKAVSGTPIKFIGVGEKLSDLDAFHPDRIAGRILGMGDVLTLVEKAQADFDEEEAEALTKKMQKAEFDLEDFRTQLKRLKKLGSIEGLLKMIPGMGALREQMENMAPPEKEMIRIEAMINSMTKEERSRPQIINPSRKGRIARGSGATVEDVDKLLTNFSSMRKMMSRMMGGKKGAKKGGKLPRMPRIPGMGGGFPGMGGMGGGQPSPEDLEALGQMGGLDGMGGMPGMPGMGDMMGGMDGMGGQQGPKGTKAQKSASDIKARRKKEKKNRKKGKKKK